MKPSAAKATCVAFVWDNFGPMHDDRCAAVQAALGPTARIIGIEIYGGSAEYDWQTSIDERFTKVTLLDERRPRDLGRKIAGIIAICRKHGIRHLFLCNYDDPAILLAAVVARLSGIRVYVMGCSKFDDYDRRATKEFLKLFWLKPYQGALSSGRRSREYMAFLGVPRTQVVGEYNTLSLERIRRAAQAEADEPAPAFDRRPFTVVARLVPKKNLAVAIRAFALFLAESGQRRDLEICGSGPEEQALRALAAELDVTEQVKFHGFLQSSDVARVLSRSLALLLPSVEEQFGNVVIEAQALGLPVLVSDRCGARDRLVRSGVNGFVFEPDNIPGLAYFMHLISSDETLWRRMGEAALQSAQLGDDVNFAAGVTKLVSADAVSLPG